MTGQKPSTQRRANLSMNVGVSLTNQNKNDEAIKVDPVIAKMKQKRE
jgi:hypothetical protein